MTDDLTPHDREMIGSGVRIEIPFADTIKLRQVAEILRGYATAIDFTTRRDDMNERSKLIHLKMEARAVNYRIKELFGIGRFGK